MISRHANTLRFVRAVRTHGHPPRLDVGDDLAPRAGSNEHPPRACTFDNRSAHRHDEFAAIGLR